jgi:hypothetical protein
MDYTGSLSVEKLLSLAYNLKGFFYGLKVYCSEEKLDKNSFTILNISSGKPEESLGFLVVYFDEEEKMYKAFTKIPSKVKESPLKNTGFIASLIQHFFDRKIVNFYFRKKV